MEQSMIIYWICAVILMLLGVLYVSPAHAVTIIPIDNADWTCYEYSVDYANSHPDYGIVTISDNQYFRGISHIVNYKFYDNKTLVIHDGYWNMDYEIVKWKDGYKFMHFWDNNETLVRSYKILQDNREEIYNSL